MPEATFASYLRLALQARGLDPDEGDLIQATDAPPAEVMTLDDLPEESRAAIRRAMAG